MVSRDNYSNDGVKEGKTFPRTYMDAPPIQIKSDSTQACSTSSNELYASSSHENGQKPLKI